MVNIKDIVKAKTHFDNDTIIETPLQYSDFLSKKFWADIYVKREDLQKVRSYKIRWAYNFISSLSEEEKKKWVVAASAWNHAQWVAFVCNKLKIKWVIFMPKTTPNQKVRKTKKFGWEFIEVKLVWDNFDEAYQASVTYCKEHGAVFVHPFDDEKVIAWQGTIWLEVLEQIWNKQVDYFLVPIGGGGLISWISTFVKSLSENTKVLWFEPFGSPDFHKSFQKWEIVSIDKVDVFADGVAVKTPWKKTFQIVKKLVDDIHLVEEGLIAKYLLDMIDDAWIILEPAGALSIAALEKVENEIKWKTVVCVLSGGNFDLTRLPEVKERALKYEWLKRYFMIKFPQRPWALKDFLNLLWKNDDIVFFEYMKKHSKQTWPALVGIETNKKENFEELIKNFKENNIDFEDITNSPVYEMMIM